MIIDWNRKLAAWLHDPAEKALILLRDREGHEHGTVARLRAQLDVAAKAFDKRADWLAAGADRPQWPRDAEKRFAGWEQVNFAREPELVHPLSGERVALPELASQIDAQQLKAVSQSHFETLLQADDPHQSFLAFWRFGPELARLAPELGALWGVQPADTRVPDHSIWNHLDLVSALHTALAGDADGPDEPALLAMSFGPVQGFISQARSTSDLWAGSHLLSTLVWEALRSVVEAVGPDTVVFPALRGVPAVDRWLAEQGGGGLRKHFEDLGAEFLDARFADDTNPLFAAALPNKFVAIVPSRQARKLAEGAIDAARQRARALAEAAARKVFDAAGVEFNDTVLAQIDAQLHDFPEAAWAAVTWPAHEARAAGEFSDPAKVDAAAQRLKAALDTIDPVLSTSGVFDAKVWGVLGRELKLDGATFWSPNTGLLYPAVYELADRALAAAKAVRPFGELKQQGHRCTLTGEAEWLTHDRTLLGKNRKDRIAAGSVWGRLAERRKSWVKPGEHLGALATLKRLWPVLFAQDLGKFLGTEVRRHVVSTHALALSTSIERLASPEPDLDRQAALQALRGITEDLDPATLPKALALKLRKLPADQAAVLRRLPTLLDGERADEDEERALGRLGGEPLKRLLGEARPETYYALILMDGDRMGGWIAGNEPDYRLRYRDTWHSKVQAGAKSLEARSPDLQRYLDTLRPNSPARHMAISQALNDFSIHLARHVVEDCCKGKLLYAGGDDVLALVAVDDLFDCMQLLRLAYSGIAPHEAMGLEERVLGYSRQRPFSRDERRLVLGRGFAFLRDRSRASDAGRLMTLMGPKATASMGAIVAHHTAPLSMVLRRLRGAESESKNSGRDAFCLRVLKRGGGEVGVTGPWWPQVEPGRPDTARSSLALMKQLTRELALTDFSRGAIYRAGLWFEGLTEGPATPEWRAQLAGALAAQFNRQKGDPALARQVVDHVCDVLRPKQPLSAVADFLAASEFFAREARSFQLEGRARREAQPRQEGDRA